MDNKHTEQDQKTPYADELAKLGVTLSEMDEPTAREFLEDMLDHAEATVAEAQAKGKPETPLKEVMRELGVDG